MRIDDGWANVGLGAEGGVFGAFFFFFAHSLSLFLFHFLFIFFDFFFGFGSGLGFVRGVCRLW